ncbi:cell division protein FtsH [Desulfobacter hydrogenophilus]|uniref:ATP-dependent zinc metalloprotease FtsH n=1 Tax=Desulfobacter hydrogenophilus TaxID=2291 RepID=A0A328F9A5_9BACT|nr:ATP-dependent zinc metalloprotease FtsH [Desulfobacter hydrogenophilus]NDY71301.1 ATP-dependent zinc metalloprotease FtsH [Desulfobacter hydrogenophilus]QBH12296.1 ATP-dependent metallopeptidase FtsH/Yme1/Tma family protein [Desulfobacter hydrogenophilus]RAM01191.1 cell division protein FtsH [Desulfobacter hydrogenophilus]
MNKTNFKTEHRTPEIEINKPGASKFWQQPNFNLWAYIIFVVLSFYLWQGYLEVKKEEIPYSKFIAYVEKNEVAEAKVTDKYISGTLKLKDKTTNSPRRFITVPLLNNELAQNLEKHGVEYSVSRGSNWFGNFLVNWVIPFGMLFLVWTWITRRMGQGGKGFLSIAGNRVHIHAESTLNVTFDDVAGAEETKEELLENVAFLKDPERVQRLGGRMPKGVLLAGPPGTGKTLLARAVAGEAKVPFFSIAGSEFIEMFVGVGAARVRELFEQARQKAPCIIFIDEIDAIGGARGIGPMMGGHDEREQTLNQLLSEMDGFDTSVGVVVMAATNRPDILDKALLRAGRFDRQIIVDKPDLKDREAILKLHSSKIEMAEDVDLHVVAQRTPGFVGADLENIANEAAIGAVRENHDRVTMEDFEAAIDRIVAGPEKKHRVLNNEEKKRVAFHESGHTLVAVTVPTGTPVHKVSIIPRGVAALGYTMQLPVDEKFLSTKNELKDQLTILLGGRVAEEIAFGDISSGAQNDLERASEIARAMVCQFGMSDNLGPLTYGKRQQLMYLGVQGQEERNYSEETAKLIDSEVRTLVEEAHEQATQILTKKRSTLDALAELLKEKEVLSGDEVAKVTKKADNDIF